MPPIMEWPIPLFSPGEEECPSAPTYLVGGVRKSVSLPYTAYISGGWCAEKCLSALYGLHIWWGGVQKSVPLPLHIWWGVCRKVSLCSYISGGGVCRKVSLCPYISGGGCAEKLAILISGRGKTLGQVVILIPPFLERGDGSKTA